MAQSIIVQDNFVKRAKLIKKIGITVFLGNEVNTETTTSSHTAFDTKASFYGFIEKNDQTFIMGIHSQIRSNLDGLACHYVKR